MQAKWYVYQLIDPRTDAPFYIGKGCGDRIFAHERQAKRGVCSKKTSIINDIWKENQKVLKSHIAYFFNEQDAYDFETDLIEEIGLANLSNVLPGGQKAWTRRLAERKVKKENDLPLHLRIKKGSFDRVASFTAALMLDRNIEVWPRYKAFDKESFMALMDVAFKEWFPALIRTIRKDADALLEFNKKLSVFGVKLNGCA